MGELIRAYPDTKIFVNRRYDTETWYQSVGEKIMQKRDLPSHFTLWRNALFQANISWMKLGQMSLCDYSFKYDFTKNGKDLFDRHY